MSKRVFLGGTCAVSTWRDELIPMLTIDYFNPVVADWTPECMAEEIRQRQSCDYVLYVITSEMEGVYSIAEVVDDSNKRPEKTVFCVLEDGFSPGQLRSLGAVKRMVEENGGTVCESLAEVSRCLNGEEGGYMNDFKLVRRIGWNVLQATKKEGASYDDIDTFMIGEKENVDEKITELRRDGYVIFYLFRHVGVIDDVINGAE